MYVLLCYLHLNNSVTRLPGVNSKCSCPEEGLCVLVVTEEEGVEELHDDDGEEERSVKLCRAGGGGGGRGGGWDGGRLLNGSSKAETQHDTL